MRKAGVCKPCGIKTVTTPETVTKTTYQTPTTEKETVTVTKTPYQTPTTETERVTVTKTPYQTPYQTPDVVTEIVYEDQTPDRGDAYTTPAIENESCSGKKQGNHNSMKLVHIC